MEAASPHLTAVEGSSDEAVSTSETDGEEVVQKRSHQQREAVFRVGTLYKNHQKPLEKP